jgi:hypothetical protein
MAAVRISKTKVQVHDFLCIFMQADEADGFWNCLAAHDLIVSEFQFQAVSKQKSRMISDDYS